MQLPAFVFANVLLKGSGKPYCGAALAYSAVHRPTRPDIMSCEGCWILDKADLESGKVININGIVRQDKESKRVWQTLDDDACVIVLTYMENFAFQQLERSICVLKSTDVLGSDKDEIKLAAVIRRHKWSTCGYDRLESLDELLGEGWGTSELLQMLENMPMAIPHKPAMVTREMPAPMGLVPATPSFAAVTQDVMRIKGMDVSIGAEAGHVSHAIEYDGEDDEICFGIILARPAADELLEIRVLYTAEQLSHTEIILEDAWELAADELVLGAELRSIDRASVRRPILLVPELARHSARLDHGDAVKIVRLVMDSDAEVKPIEEPVTDKSLKHDFIEIALAKYGGNLDVITKPIRNECRLQITPDEVPNLRAAVAEIRDYDHGKFMLLMRGREPEWLGDRELTFVYYLSGDDDVQALWPCGLPNGWVVPEKMPGKSGRKRVRAAKHRGYMLVFTHQDVDGKGANKITYCLETKTLTITLAVGFFNENLEFDDGAEPPACDLEGEYDREHVGFDIVNRVWMDRSSADAPVWNEGRALLYYGRE